MSENEIVLKTEKITKNFPGVLALDKVDFELKRGEIHAICGENGAGKSTFCNIITGIFNQDEGNVFYNGKKVKFSHPSEALKAGIRMVYQERNLIPYLTGAQNILLKEEPLKKGIFIDEKEILKRAEELEKKYKMNVPFKYPVSQLSSAKKQAIEILRALLYKPKVLILDEPTSSLTETESETLFNVINQIKKDGVSVILITHKMDEVFETADRISIFRNGKKVHTSKKDEITEEECIRLMVNRNITSLYPPVNYSGKEIIMDVDSISDYTLVKDNSFYLRSGEVLGFYGLIGSGRTELIELIYGLRLMKSGTIKINDENAKPDPQAMMDKNVYLVPDDRREKGLILRYDLKQNLTISFIKNFTKMFGLVNSGKEKRLAEKIVGNDTLKIKYVNLNQGIDLLSGGNQQKVVISRWISKEKINVLILDEPTNGIDVGTKYEIYKMIRELAEKKNIGVIFISSELPELTGICDRIYVFKEGTINGELERKEFNDEKILSLAL